MKPVIITTIITADNLLIILFYLVQVIIFSRNIIEFIIYNKKGYFMVAI
jgi:hypothetical protein